MVNSAVWLGPLMMELHFRHVLKTTVRDEIMRARMERVKSLLRDASDSVESIAATCGFASASHLCSVFKRRTGVTPFTFRRKGEAARFSH